MPVPMCSLNEAFDGGLGPSKIPSALGPNSSSSAHGNFPEREPKHELGQYDGLQAHELNSYSLDKIGMNLESNPKRNLEGFNADQDLIDDFEEYVDRFDKFIEKYPRTFEPPEQPSSHTKDDVLHHQYQLSDINLNENYQNLNPASLSPLEQKMSDLVDVILLGALGIFVIFALEQATKLN